MNLIVNGLWLLCSLWPSLAHAGTEPEMMLADAGPQDRAATQRTAEDSEDVDDIDARAVAELKKMTAFLDTYEAIIIKTRTTWEAIQDSGMKLQFDADQEIGIRRPNQMYSRTVRDDGKTRKFWYDRNMLTYLDVDKNTYAQLPVPETVNEMLDYMLDNFDLPAPPLLDFLYNDAETSFLSEIESALYVGECTKGGVRCHHLAFSRTDIDYQLWIPTTGPPLPVKYAISWKNTAHIPWFIVEFTEWITSPSFSAESFSFALPAGSTKIEAPTASE